MTNLTMIFDSELLKKARIRALEEGTSVNALMREVLRRYALRQGKWEDVLAQIDEIAKKSKASSGGKKWTRASLYERR